MKAVITVIGKDMVGILAKVSTVCAEKGINVIEVPDITPWQEACKDIIDSSTADNKELYQKILDMK